jgi:signal transduction histidine kinase
MTQAIDLPDTAALLLTRLDDLRRAERRAASARMVSVAGHLAGTPLNVIAGRAALIRVNPSPEAIEENVRRIEEQVERMAMRIRRLVDYFGLGEGSIEQGTVGEILAECRALYLPVAELKGVSLMIDAGTTDALGIEAEVTPLVLTTLTSLAVRPAARGQSVTLEATEHGPSAVAFEWRLPTLEVPPHFERFEPPEHGGHYDPGTLEALWTCLGLAHRVGGTLVIARPEAGPAATLRFECAHH